MFTELMNNVIRISLAVTSSICVWNQAINSSPIYFYEKKHQYPAEMVHVSDLSDGTNTRQ